jgi:hypothetical protein
MMARREHPGKAGLLAGSEVVKYLMALATGSIVFSAGLLNEKTSLSPSAKWFIFTSWVALALSILGGILASMRIPVQLTEQNYNFEDKFLKYPGLVQQLAFLLGILLLGIALTITLYKHGAEPTASTEPMVIFQSIGSSPTPMIQPTPASSPTPSNHHNRKGCRSNQRL